MTVERVCGSIFMCACVFTVCRRWAATSASTPTRWRIAAESAWATARAARPSTGRLTTEKASVRGTVAAGCQLNHPEINIYTNIAFLVTQNRQAINEEKALMSPPEECEKKD